MQTAFADICQKEKGEENEKDQENIVPAAACVLRDVGAARHRQRLHKRTHAAGSHGVGQGAGG